MWTLPFCLFSSPVTWLGIFLRACFEDEKKHTVNLLLHASLVADAQQLIGVLLINNS